MSKKQSYKKRINNLLRARLGLEEKAQNIDLSQVERGLNTIAKQNKDISEENIQVLKGITKELSKISDINQLSNKQQKAVFNSINKGFEKLEGNIKKEFEKKNASVLSLFKEFEKKKPDWYVQPKSQMEVKNTVKVEKDDGLLIDAINGIALVITTTFGSLVSFLAKLSGRVFQIMPAPAHYTIPQRFVLVDPVTHKEVRPEDIGKTAPAGAQHIHMQGGTGPTHVGARGASEFNDGFQVVVTAGQRVRLADDIPCSSVTVQSNLPNGQVVIGGKLVVAEKLNRRGLSLFNAQWERFKVANVNQLWIDSTEDNARVNFVYES